MVITAAAGLGCAFIGLWPVAIFLVIAALGMAMSGEKVQCGSDGEPLLGGERKDDK